MMFAVIFAIPATRSKATRSKSPSSDGSSTKSLYSIPELKVYSEPLPPSRKIAQNQDFKSVRKPQNGFGIGSTGRLFGDSGKGLTLVDKITKSYTESLKNFESISGERIRDLLDMNNLNHIKIAKLRSQFINDKIKYGREYEINGSNMDHFVEINLKSDKKALIDFKILVKREVKDIYAKPLKLIKKYYKASSPELIDYKNPAHINIIVLRDYYIKYKLYYAKNEPIYSNRMNNYVARELKSEDRAEFIELVAKENKLTTIKAVKLLNLTSK